MLMLLVLTCGPKRIVGTDEHPTLTPTPTKFPPTDFHERAPAIRCGTKPEPILTALEQQEQTHEPQQHIARCALDAKLAPGFWLTEFAEERHKADSDARGGEVIPRGSTHRAEVFAKRGL